MPSKSRPTFNKRAKERARQEKQQAKTQRRLERKQEKSDRPAGAADFEIGEPQDALFADDDNE
jgi:hypothetical protein